MGELSIVVCMGCSKGDSLFILGAPVEALGPYAAAAPSLRGWHTGAHWDVIPCQCIAALLQAHIPVQGNICVQQKGSPFIVFPHVIFQMTCRI